MIFQQYYRTEKGSQTLDNRSIKLSSRQRALLLMIENRQNNELRGQQLQQLATPDNLAILLEHQLIATHAAYTQLSQPWIESPETLLHSGTETEITDKPTVSPSILSILDEPYDVITPDLNAAVMTKLLPDCLSFEEVKQLMIDGLREYCGLLASMLIKEVQHASTISKLRLCQMRWVTTLTETRATHAQIAAWVEQINYSLSCWSDNTVTLPEAIAV